jgi:hypothetical protein
MAEPVIVFQKIAGNTHIVLADYDDGTRRIISLSADGETVLLSLSAEEALELAQVFTDFHSIASQVPFSHFEPEQAEVEYIDPPVTNPVTQEPVPVITTVAAPVDPEDEAWTDIPGSEFTIEPSA